LGNKGLFEGLPGLGRGLEKWVRGKLLPHRLVFYFYKHKQPLRVNVTRRPRVSEKPFQKKFSLVNSGL
jgi:hypothetical protein